VIPEAAPGTALQNAWTNPMVHHHITFLGLGALVLWGRHQHPAAGMGVSTASIHPIGHDYEQRSSTPLGRTLCLILMQSPTGESRTLFRQFLDSGRERHLRVCSSLARRHIALLTAEQGLLFLFPFLSDITGPPPTTWAVAGPCNYGSGGGGMYRRQPQGHILRAQSLHQARLS
jgi:hypothetical protein